MKKKKRKEPKCFFRKKKHVIVSHAFQNYIKNALFLVNSCFFLCAVQARDSSPRPMSGTATVLCSVLDDNDNPPDFMQSSFQISIPENLPPGVIHTAQASDPDHGENGTIHYSILGKISS